MENKEEALVVAPSEIGEIRAKHASHESAAGTGGEADVGDTDDGDSPLLVSRSGRRGGRRKHNTTDGHHSPPKSSKSKKHETDTSTNDPENSLPVSANPSSVADTQVAPSDSVDSHVSHSSGAAYVSTRGEPSVEISSAEHCQDSRQDQCAGGPTTSNLAAATDQLESGLTSMHLTTDTLPAVHTPVKSSTPVQELLPPGHSPGLTPIRSSPGRGQDSSSSDSSAAVIPSPRHTPTRVAHHAANSSSVGLATPRCVTASCEVVRSQDLPEDVETADEAEADAMTEVLMDSNMLSPNAAGLLRELESQARFVADDLNHMIGNMTSNLHAMSAVSASCMESYKESVDDLGVNVDDSIKSMYLLIARCEEISRDMKPVYNLADQIKSIKQTLVVFEQLCKP